jgi:RND superfamily putative drug exporter
VITAAASIMILVFLSFVLNASIIIQQFGVGLAAAIIVDAFVVRTVLVPALLHLCGPANWWLPGCLDGWLPTLHLESEAGSARAAAGPPRNPGDRSF